MGVIRFMWLMGSKMIRKRYHDLLRFVICHKWLSNTIGKTKWFKHLVYEEAQWIIGNRWK